MSIGQPQRIPFWTTRSILTGGNFGRDTAVLYISGRDTAVWYIRPSERYGNFVYTTVGSNNSEFWGVMDRQVCYLLTWCFHLRLFRTSLGDATACLAPFSNKSWRCDRMSPFCKAKYKSSNLEAACCMCWRFFTCVECSTTGEVDAKCDKVHRVKTWTEDTTVGPTTQKFWRMIFGRDATVCIHSRWVRRLQAWGVLDYQVCPLLTWCFRLCLFLMSLDTATACHL